jgi:hydrogenase maturation factor
VWIEFENGNRFLPKVFIEDGLFNDLCLPWQDSLVIKLLGKEIGFYQLNTRLRNLWKLTGGFELMDVVNGFFMVNFDLEEDKEKVINEGPRMVFDHY